MSTTGVGARRVAVVALALGFVTSCQSAGDGSLATRDGGATSLATGLAGHVGASIALIDRGTRLAVVNPDQGSVSFLDPDSLALQSTTLVGGEPHALLEVTSGTTTRLLVAGYRSGEVVAIDETRGKVAQRIDVCAGAYGLAASGDGSWVAVSCEWDGTVRRLDVATLQVSTLTTGLRRPRALAVVGADVYVADYVGGLVHVLPESGDATRTSLVPRKAAYRPALTVMSANLASAVVPAFGNLYVAHALENNTGDDSLEPVADDYGTVTNTNPKINPAVTGLVGDAPVLYARFDGGTRVYSGPSALAAYADRYLLVTHVSTANVAVLDTRATSPDERAVGTFTVGAGPVGIAVDGTRHVAYVDNALDQSVSRISLDQAYAAGAPLFTTSATRVRDLPSPYSEAAQAGRRLFFDATNPHVTPSGVLACASCHPGGGDDGLVWFEHTPNVPLKRRRTPHLANAKTPTAPFHWNGQFETMSSLVTNTMTNIMAGDGLLVAVDSIQPFLDEIVQAPTLPVTDEASVARGETLFRSTAVGCSLCHSGSYLTDDRLHAVLDPMTLHADDVFPEANTPGLHGVFLLAPYFHDGRAASLEDVLTQPYAARMGHAQDLSSAELTDLIHYLESL